MKIGTSMGLMVLVAALLMGTAAAQTDDSEVTGTLSEIYEIAATDAAFGSFTIGENTATCTVTVSTNYDVVVQGSPASGAGKMASTTPTDLTEELEYTIDDGAVAAGTSSSVENVEFTQEIVYGDTDLDSYSITVTFSCVAPTP